jgi:hypothetical protein
VIAIENFPAGSGQKILQKKVLWRTANGPVGYDLNNKNCALQKFYVVSRFRGNCDGDPISHVEEPRGFFFSLLFSSGTAVSPEEEVPQGGKPA